MKQTEIDLIFSLVFRKSLKSSIKSTLIENLHFFKKNSSLNEKTFFKKSKKNFIIEKRFRFSKKNFFFNGNLNFYKFYISAPKKNSPRSLISVKENFVSDHCFLLGHKTFDEVFIPHISSKWCQKKIFKTQYLPNWIRFFFKNLKEFNYIQTIVFPVSFGTDINLLICSPTGTGKTNIALFGILRTILNSISFKPPEKKINRALVKILYLAPMRSLVKEIAKNFQNLFKKKGLKIIEATGDSDISKNEIENANILIGTPEKIDIFSRKEHPQIDFGEFKLFIVDEIHLLNEKRGSILEEILVRCLTNVKNKKSRIRIIGLSATLPNYHDIGKFLQVNPRKGIFYFGPHFRPIPLNKTVIGVKKSLESQKNTFFLNGVLFSLVKKIFIKNSSKNLIIFVHSRRDTLKTGIFLSHKLNVLKNFKKNKDLKKKNHFNKNLQMIKSKELKNLIEKGIGIHHAGLSKSDRNIIENFFREGYLNIIISTATLAWGLNLPATHVIIKGTKIYSPEKSSWVEIPDFNVIQMLGRAGRILNCPYSEGIVITTINNLSHYTDLFNNQMPIESRLITSLPDCLNTECSGNRVFDIFSAFNWFSKTFIRIRLGRTITPNFLCPRLRKKRDCLTFIENVFISESLNELIGAGMILLNNENGKIMSTPFGKISSEFNVSYQTILLLLSQISYNSTYFEIFRLISLSSEFSSFHLRKGEKTELSRLENLIFFPSREESLSQIFKVNILLQSYIGKLNINSLSLGTDSIFIGRVALRISRALFEISVYKRLAKLSQNCFRIFRAIRNRIWENEDVPPHIFSSFLDKQENRNSEKKIIDLDLSRDPFFQKSKKNSFSKKEYSVTGKTQNCPSSIKISFFLQPITRNTIRIHFVFFFELGLNDLVKNNGIGLWFFIEDPIYDTLIFFSYLRIKKKKTGKNFHFSIQIPIFDNPPSPYFRLRILPDKMIGSDLEFSIDLTQLVFPVNFQIETKLLGIFCSGPARLFSGFQGGLVLLEYFLTHFQQFSPFFLQIFPHILKKTGKKIFLNYEKSLRSNFMEISIISYFLSCRSLVGFFVSCGGESINLKIVQIKKSSASIIGLPVSKFNKEIEKQKPENVSKKVLIILSPNEFNSFGDKIFKNTRKNLVFFTESVHLLGDWNFGNSIEEVLDQIQNSCKKSEHYFFSGSLLPVNNSFDLLRWLGIEATQIFCQKLRTKPVSPMKNQPFILRNQIHKQIKKEKILIIFSNNYDVKKRIFLFFFSFLTSFAIKNPKNFLAPKKCLYGFYERKKIQILLSFLKIGWIDDSDDFNYRRIIQELNISKKLKAVFLTIGPLANISLETLASKRVICPLQSKKDLGVGFFSSKIPLLKERCKEIHQIGNDSFSFDDKNISLESLWDIWFIEKILNFLNRKKLLNQKDFYEYFLGSFFCIRLLRNPNFYCVSKKIIENFSTKNFIYSVLNVLNDKKYIISDSKKSFRISKKIQKFFKFGQFQKWFFLSFFSCDKTMDSFEKLKKISSEHFCDIIRKNPIFVWFLDKKFLKKRLIFQNEKGLSFFKTKENQIELIKLEIKLMVSLLIKYFRFDGSLKSILHFIEFTQLIQSGSSTTKPNLYMTFTQENLAPFLVGKIHGIFWKKNLIQLIFSPVNLNKKNIPQKNKELFFRSLGPEYKLFVNFSIIKKKRGKTIRFDFGFSLKSSFMNFSNFLLQNEKFFKKDPNFWWIIIGDVSSNRIFLCKRIKNLTRFHVEMDFLLKKDPSEIRIFALNETCSELDKEAKFLLDSIFPQENNI